MAKDVGQKERPTLLDAPSLRYEIETTQGFAYQLDGFDQQLFFFMLEADFDGALAAMTRQTGDSTQQRGPASDRFAVMLGIVEPHIEMPPVIDQRHHVGHQSARRQFSSGKAIPPPLVFELIINVFRVSSLAIESCDGLGRKGHRLKRCDKHRDAARPGRDFSRPLLSAWQRSGQVVASTSSLLAHWRQGRCFADQHYASLPAPATGASGLLPLFPSPHRTAAKLRPIAAPA